MYSLEEMAVFLRFLSPDDKYTKKESRLPYLPKTKKYLLTTY